VSVRAVPRRRWGVLAAIAALSAVRALVADDADAGFVVGAALLPVLLLLVFASFSRQVLARRGEGRTLLEGVIEPATLGVVLAIQVVVVIATLVAG
jgi:hypothetical protein